MRRPFAVGNDLFALFLGCAATLAYADSAPYTARPAQKYGSAQATYVTTANKIPRKLSSMEEQSLPDRNRYFGVTNFLMVCPGFSLLNHVESTYDSYLKDRVFTFGCVFLEDQQGNLITKVSCSKTYTPTDYEKLQNGVSKCSADEFIHGIESKKFVEGRMLEDRIDKSYCCTMKDLQGQAVRPTAECTTHSYAAGTDFNMSCPTGAVVKEIKTTYFPNTADRAHQFLCCKAGP